MTSSSLWSARVAADVHLVVCVKGVDGDELLVVSSAGGDGVLLVVAGEGVGGDELLVVGDEGGSSDSSATLSLNQASLVHFLECITK